MDTTRIIIDAIKTDRITASAEADARRQRLAAQVRRGLRAEARLVAAQVREYGPTAAKRLAAKRGRDRAAVMAAVLSATMAEVRS
jgi:hypothetical protein